MSDDSGGWTALHRACQEGCEIAVEQLLADSPELLDAVTHDGSTALHVAAHAGHDNIVARLLACGPKLTSSTGWTALHSAAENGHAEVVARLLAHSPKLAEVATDSSWTALHGAAENGHDAVVAQLLAHSPQLADAVTADGFTALHGAAEGGHDKVVARLLAHRPELADADSRGWTPLRCAVNRGKEQVVELLLAFKPEQVRDIDLNGNTLLHRVVDHNLHDFSDKLVEHVWTMDKGAVHTVNADSLSPLEVAVRSGNWRAVELMQWRLSFDAMAQVLTAQRCPEELARVRAVLEGQCEEPLLAALNRDVLRTVYEYLPLPYLPPGLKRKHSSD